MLKNIRTIKISAFLLLILMITAACGGGGPSVEESVALTVAANVEPTLSVDQVVALTVAANVEPTLSVDQVVALTVAASNPQPPAGPDVANPNSGIQPIQPAADPNAASGTPQLRAALNANVRNGPGTNYRVISALLKDSVVTAVAKNQSGTWFLIELPGGSKGWIADSVTNPVNVADMGKVPVAATIPAPPPPTATTTPTPTATATATSAATATSGATATATNPSTTTTPTHTPTPAVTLISPTAVPSTIEIYNNSGIDVCYVLTSPAGQPYGSNLLSGTLYNGDTMYFSYPDAGPYDLYAQECAGGSDYYWDEYNIFNDFSWELN